MSLLASWKSAFRKTVTGKLSARQAMKMLTHRYRAEPEALVAVLCPLLVPIDTLDKRIFIAPGQNHARASFTVRLNGENSGVLVRGRTCQFVPASYGEGEPEWREIAKGRIIDVDEKMGVAEGEIYLGFGGKATDLQAAIAELSEHDLLEIDQYGVAAKADQRTAARVATAAIRAKRSVSRMARRPPRGRHRPRRDARGSRGCAARPPTRTKPL